VNEALNQSWMKVCPQRVSSDHVRVGFEAKIAGNSVYSSTWLASFHIEE
jgi:hypothetical protein